MTGCNRRRLYFVGHGGSSWRDPRNWSREEGGHPLSHFHARGGDVVIVGRVDGHEQLDLRGMPHACLELRGYAGRLRLPDGGRVTLAAAPATRLGRLRARVRREVRPVVPAGFRGAVEAAGGWRRTIRDGLALLTQTRRGLVLVPRLEGAAVTRFWVGGTGTWDNAATGHWSATSGGASGAAAPTNIDTAVFDANSGFGTANTLVTVAATAAAATVTISGLTAIKNSGFAFAGNLTITGTFTLGGNSTQGVNRLLWTSTVVGTQRTVTAAAYVVSGDVDFQDINLAYSGSALWTNAGAAYIGDCGGNAGAVTTNANASSTQTWTTTGAGNWSDNTKWTTRVPLPQDDVSLNKAFVANPTVAIDMPRIGRSVDMTNTGAASVTVSRNLKVMMFGSLTLASYVTISGGAQQWTFAGRGAYTLTSAGKAFLSGSNSLTLAAPGGTITQQDAVSLAATVTLSITNGTWNANNNNVTVGSVVSNGTLTRAITMGSGTWTLSATSNVTVWNLGTTTGLTFSGASATIIISATDAFQKTFFGGGLTYGTLQQTATGTAILVINDGNNTFSTLDLECSTSRTVAFADSTTTFVTSVLTLKGNGGSTLTLDNVSASGAVPATIKLSSGATLTQTNVTIANNGGPDVILDIGLVLAFAGGSTLSGTLNRRPLAITLALAGSSSLSATVTPYQRITPTLAGSATLAATLTPYQRVVLALAGTSALNATLTPYQRMQLNLAGTSALAATLTPYQRMALTLAGSSSLAATVTPYQRITPALAGASSLTATLTPYQEMLLALAGRSSVAATLTPYQRILATIAGSSSLSATVTPYQRVALALAGSSSLAAALTPYERFVAILSGSSSLAATLTPYQEILATLAGTSNLTAAVTPYQEIEAILAGTSSLSATLTPYQRIEAILAGQSSLSASLLAARLLTPSFAGASSLSATLTEYHNLTALLAGAASLNATLTPYQRMLLDLAGASALTATLEEYQRIIATLAGTSSLAVALSRDGIRVDLAGRSSLTATLIAYHRFLAVLAGSSSLTGDLFAYRRFVAALAGSSSLSATLTESQLIMALLAGSSSLAVDLTVIVQTVLIGVTDGMIVVVGSTDGRISAVGATDGEIVGTAFTDGSIQP